MKLITVLFIIGISSSTVLDQTLAKQHVEIEAGSLGKIRGTIDFSHVEGHSKFSTPYAKFLGIPYAYPATESKRFLPSVLREELGNPQSTFEALEYGPACRQPSFGGPLVQDEDCLTINVFSPTIPGNYSQDLPVLFFIHGGAFTVGSGRDVAPDRFMNRPLVYVSFNYRLGAFGFFSLRNDLAPGNAGLYDIINALEWTRKFIRFFGGNPNLITVAGQSAGSAAATHIMLSPLSKGKIARVIAASGNALNKWATTENAVQGNLKLAQSLRCHNAKSPSLFLLEVAECMKSVDPNDLVTATFMYQVEQRNNGNLGSSVVSPTLQDFHTVYPKVLPEMPQAVLDKKEQANVPFMTGATQHDGSYVLGIIYKRFLEHNGYLNDTNFMKYRLIPKILELLSIPDSPKGIHESLGTGYLREDKHTGDFERMYPGLMDICSVFFFKAAAYDMALQHSEKNSDTYWYNFEFRGRETMFEELFANDPPPFNGGVTHSDDLIYLYKITHSPFNSVEAAVSEEMIDIWTNFVHFGKPTFNREGRYWPPLQKNDRPYLKIGRNFELAYNYDNTWAGPGYDLVNPTPPAPSTSSPPENTGSNAKSGFFMIVIISPFIGFLSTMPLININ